MLSDSALAVIAQALHPDERIDMVAHAVGSDLVLTNQRLIVLRDGARFRPSSGLRSFVIDRGLEVRMGPHRNRVIIETAGTAINVFVRSDQPEPVEALLAELRRRIYSE